jgi:hypothetical protein
MHEVFYVESGKGVFMVEDQPIQLEPGQVRPLALWCLSYGTGLALVDPPPHKVR